MKNRNEIDQKYKWDLTKIYPTEESFNEELSQAGKLIKDFAKHEKTMCKNAAGLLAALVDMTDISEWQRFVLLRHLLPLHPGFSPLIFLLLTRKP